MTPPRRPAWPAILLLLIGLAAWFAHPLAARFLNDDFLFLEQAHTRPLLESLARLDPLANYVRPVSRQLWFAALAPIGGGDPRVFHAASAVVFAVALALLADLLGVFAPPIGVLAGVVYLALLPASRVLLTWISCSQDLLALAFTLAALACFRRGRGGWTLAFQTLAVFSKESALPLPLVALAWAIWIDRDPLPAAVRRVAPLALPPLVWLVVTWTLRGHAGFVLPTLAWSPLQFVAAWLHEAQSLIGLDTWQGLGRPFAHFPRDPIPFLALALAGAWLLWPARRAATDPAPAPAPVSPAAHPAERAATRFGVAWLVAFGVVLGPVAASWSAYFYTLAAVGAAILVARAARSLGTLGWAAAVALALWASTISFETRAFAVVDDPWGWTTHLDSGYFDRAAALGDTLSHQLAVLEPHPAHDTRFFFATLPSWAGFQMGNGALIRAQYRDPTLRSYFYSQFSESTAAWAPVRVYYWDGRTFAPLYDRAPDPWFQIGSDLMLFGHPDRAAHAFRRGLAAGHETRFDLLYELGWAELMRGHRGAAERAWLDAGMREDTSAWFASMRHVRQSLIEDRDTLAARRALAKAIMTGPGQPLPHALLGQLMRREHRPKYALLELSVAIWLEPDDRVSRRALALGLAEQQLDDAARVQLAWLEQHDAGWRHDPELAAMARELDARALPNVKVARF